MSFTFEQQEQRLNHICGSDAAVICGISPWNNIIKLWQEKTRLKVSEDISDDPRVKAGIMLEPIVRAWFEDVTGLKVDVHAEFIEHGTLSFLGGHVDGLVGDDAIFEAKTAGYDDGWGAQGENIIPDHYLMQVAHYMMITDRKKAYVAVLIRGSDFRHYVIERNYQLEKMIINQYKKFWENVLTNIAPEPKNGDEVLSLYGYKSIAEPIVADGDIQNDLDTLENIKQTLKKANEVKDKLEDRIKIYMGQKDTLLTLNGKIAATWKQAQESVRFDLTAFKKENKELHDKYVKSSTASRRFVLKQQEGL